MNQYMTWRIAGAIALISPIAVMPSAKAQVVATIQNIQPAPLVIDTPYTTFDSAQPAIVTIQMNEAASMVVTAPTPLNFSDPEGTQHASTLSYNNITVANGSPLNINAIGIIDLEIGMQVIRPEPYPANAYTYSVQLTVIPQ